LFLRVLYSFGGSNTLYSFFLPKSLLYTLFVFLLHQNISYIEEFKITKNQFSIFAINNGGLLY
ncbi:hypothetical protein C0J52_22847, partial [Blattella germanica]